LAAWRFLFIADLVYGARCKRIHSEEMAMRPLTRPKALSTLGALTLLLLGPLVARLAGGAPREELRRLPRDVLEDKVRGGWAGQMIGVSFGAPTEFRSNGKIIEGPLPWSPEWIANALSQDDLYVDMTFAAVMDRVGLQATTQQYGEAFKDTKYPLWHANAAARHLLARGVKAPWSGHPKYNIHANDIDFQIEADFIGLMTPGLPQESNKYAERVGRVMNHGDGLYGGMFVSALYAAAFFEKDVGRLVAEGLAAIPPQSGYARIIGDVVELWRTHPQDWRAAWRALQGRWDRHDSCPQGALAPFNIDARLNGAYVAMGLLYGAGDFRQTLEITTRLGQDSDCNPASSAGVVGVMLGYAAIPDDLKAGLPAIAGKKFDHTDYSFDDIVRSTITRAGKVAASVGGKLTDEELLVPMQRPRPPRLEQWDMGVPARNIEAGAADWTFKGAWRSEARWGGEGLVLRRATDSAGAEAALTFEGTAIALLGRGGQGGARADVHLDGKRMGILDPARPDDTHDDTLWHTYGLPPGKHTLRLVARAEPDPKAPKKWLEIWGAITYRAR
jgi:hypothetical protein